jgi:hypothetical protein
LTSTTRVGADRGDLVEAVLAGDDQRAVDAQLRERAGDRLEEALVRDADQLPARRRPGWSAARGG